jgi:hypothetical protein
VFRAFAQTRAGWSAERLDLVDAGFALYWSRGVALARRAPWVPPRRRHLAVVVGDPLAVRPYTQLLNTSAWLLYEADVDPATSHPELLAWLLAVGDRMAATGEVTLAPVQTAAWWLERSDAECAAFADATARSTRPDADAVRATAHALPWLRRLAHETLRPPALVGAHRPVPGTGLLVPANLEAEPPALAARWAEVARATVERFQGRWRVREPAVVTSLLDWLADEKPPLLVTGERGRIVWDPDAPDRLGAIRQALRDADAAAVAAIRNDLAAVARVTRLFHAAVVEPSALPAPAENTFQSGYTYLHATRRLVAYNLHEEGMERLRGPALPYACAMVAARTAHEWGHLADAAGWVVCTTSREEYDVRRAGLAAALDAVVAAAPAALRRTTAADLDALAREAGTPGTALARLTLRRLPDWRTNLVARTLLDAAERETYVRHNVRLLRPEYPPPAFWRLLIRHLFEVQYVRPALGMTAVPDPFAFYLHSTGAADELAATGVCDAAGFVALADAVAACCAAWAVDPARLRLPAI